MNSFTPLDVAALNDLLEGGMHVATAAYDPTTVTAVPPVIGWTEYYREETARLVEIFYVKTAPAGGVPVHSTSVISIGADFSSLSDSQYIPLLFF